MYFRLKSDKYSTFRTKVMYAKKGERVKLVSDNNGICIVEGKNGRFSIKTTELTISI